MAISVETFDHPVPFLLFTTMGVIAMMALFAWLFTVLGWTGPLGLVKGGQAG
jgi:hypothetical protein